ncbi:MAG: hypothetical protein ABI376_06235 [Caulobacteraceae bacterium]
MPHVDVHHRVYLGAGHHRQPRNGQPWVEPYGSSGYDPVQGTPVHEVAFDTISFTLGGNPAVLTANFVFWSANTASNGTTQIQTDYSAPATAENLTLIAWYYLPASGGTGIGGSAEIIDAYSVALGYWVNDNFVDVTSDPSLTNEANAGGDVATAVAETVQAWGSIASTGEFFDQWVVSPGPATASGRGLNLPAGADGFAFATYDRHTSTLPKVGGVFSEGVVILDGIINDVPGHVLVHGVPTPVDPGWGTILREIFGVLGIASDAGRLSKAGASRVRAAAAAEMGAIAGRLGALAKRGFSSRG